MSEYPNLNTPNPWLLKDIAKIELQLKGLIIDHGWEEETMVMPHQDVSYYRSPLTGHLHPLSFAVGCVFGEYGIKA